MDQLEAARQDRLDLLIQAHQRGEPIDPRVRAVAETNFSLDILKWLNRTLPPEPPIVVQLYPSQLQVKSQLDPRIQLGSPLDQQGFHSTVRQACFLDNCGYVAKVIPYQSRRDMPPGCYTPKDLAKLEIDITNRASILGVAPPLFDVALGEQEAIIVTPRQDGSLEELLHHPEVPMQSILDQVERLVRRLHEYGIVHRDLNPRNILYTNGGPLVIIDYGMALRSDDERLRQADLDFIRSMREVAQEIDVEDPYFRVVETTLLPAVEFEWMGVPCPDWQ